MLEVWKQIQGNPDYLISNKGRFYSNISDKFLKCSVGTHGYTRVCINRKPTDVHRLMAINFIPNPLNLPEVDHKDRVRTNYQLNNLRWVTSSINGLNSSLRIDNKVGHKNISFCKKRNKYVYSSSYRGKYHMKRFNTLEEAINYKIKVQR